MSPFFKSAVIIVLTMILYMVKTINHKSLFS